MGSENHSGAHESVPGIPEPIQALAGDVMQVSDKMILLTWLTFGIAAFCLHRLLWKPILKAVASRERSIADALDGAENARREIAQTEGRNRELLDRAAGESRAMAERAAREAEAVVARADQEAKRAARRRVEEAEQAIAAERLKAAEQVRRDAARHLGDVVERLLRQNLTDEQKRAYQAAMLDEVKV